ncbi:hypothetical protein BDZ94DRAFT_115786 [Collybia nuda]|uniref:Transmembrane protein n=1 Tax=Collybia nuda TaxID=64659 RepID=A0A9P6CAF8_9AGAR|nr:hypothetical protein BDZ94DRAFT_115786 [Collybia nuda]
MLTRPPPLQLQLDNNRPPVQPLAQVKTLVSQIYQTNWRNFVIGVAVINALRSLISASNAFQDVGVDYLNHVPKLARISTALGAMYIAVAVIELYGVFSVSMQRLGFIQVYAYLAFVSALLVTVTGFIGSVSYFVLADDVVRECVSLALNGKLDSKSLFSGDPWPRKVLSLKATQDPWSSESITQALSVFIFSLLPSVAFFLLAYFYYRQITDSRHPASLCVSGPRSAIHLEAYPEANYSPLYNGTPPPYSDDIADALRAPGRRSKKPRPRPSVGPLVLPSMVQSASPYGVTPGPPSFGPSRNYQPGSAFFTIGSDDGRFMN